MQALPAPRRLGAAPIVPEVGRVFRADGTPATVPITPALALRDLLLYEEELLSLYPLSGITYPSDSLVQVQLTRAAAWVTRLRREQATADAATDGWQLVPFAKVAARAGDDTLARRLFDSRVAALAARPAERAYTLAEAIATFADPSQDQVRLRHNLVLAETYAAQLRSLRPLESPSPNDSAAILYRQFRAEDTLVVAYAILSTLEAVSAHAERALAIAPCFGPEERTEELLLVYGHVAMALAEQPHGLARIDTLGTRIIGLARPKPEDRWGASLSPQDRISFGREIEQNARDRVAAVVAMHTFVINKSPAPPIAAHAWLNTSDSAYQATPVTRAFADGVLRVLLFGHAEDGDRLPVLERIHHWFPRAVEGVLVTSTGGSVGPDLVAPAEETAWLAAYYIGARNFTMPIAVWAGSKAPVTMPEGKIGMQPLRPPADTSAYRHRAANFVVVDGQGNVRLSQDVTTRVQEAALRRRLEALLAETR